MTNGFINHYWKNSTAAAGTEITGVVAGAVFLDFVAGTITLPEGSTAPLTRVMSKNLNDLGLQQMNSIGIWCSDADAQYQVGSAISLADHQLNHVICNYGFNTVRIDIPETQLQQLQINYFLWLQLMDG